MDKAYVIALYPIGVSIIGLLIVAVTRANKLAWIVEALVEAVLGSSNRRGLTHKHDALTGRVEDLEVKVFNRRAPRESYPGAE